MQILVALDKFKEAITAPETCAVVAVAIRSKHPDATLDLCPLTDGGDGFVAALCARLPDSVLRETTVHGPMGLPVAARWALIPPTEIPTNVRAMPGFAIPGRPLAIIEMAACSGLAQVPRDRRDPLRASTRGVGELIMAALEAGAGGILLGVGGSATNDLGIGSLAALGFRFLDAAGTTLADPPPGRWPDVAQIEPPAAAPWREVPITIACDVNNPLLGPDGATFTYGPQKGLTTAQLPVLDNAMRRMSGLLASATGRPTELFAVPGTGAAGGITAGLMAGLGARLTPGFDLVSSWLELPSRIDAADIVITGEGAFDATSLQGKGPGSLVRAALAAGKRVVVLAGRVDLPSPPPGLEAHAITPPGMPLAEALPATRGLLAEAVRARL